MARDGQVVRAKVNDSVLGLMDWISVITSSSLKVVESVT